LGPVEALIGTVIEHPAQNEPPGDGEVRGKRHRPGQPPGHDLARGAFVDPSARQAFEQDHPEDHTSALTPT